MSKKARDHRVRIRRDDRYCDGRPKAEDLDAHHYGWNKAQVRSLSKWQRQMGQLLFQDELSYMNWLHFGMEHPLVKGTK